jgi:hypothetical protein
MSRIARLLIALVATAPVVASAQDACTTKTLKGSYVFTGHGFIEPGDPGVERVHAGVLEFDGVGAVSGHQTSSRAGKIGHEKLTGSYALAADCSGTMSFGSVAKPGGAVHWDVYVLPDGHAGHMLRTDDGSMAVRDFHR